MRRCIRILTVVLLLTPFSLAQRDLGTITGVVPILTGRSATRQRRPGQKNLDLSLFKEFRATERWRVQF